MDVVPGAIAEMTPVELIVATPVFVDPHVTGRPDNTPFDASRKVANAFTDGVMKMLESEAVTDTVFTGASTRMLTGGLT